MDTPADIGIRKIEMAVIRDEAEKMGVSGKNWLGIVTHMLKSGGGKVKVIDVKGDYANIVANHPLGHVLGPVKVPTRALVAAVGAFPDNLWEMNIEEWKRYRKTLPFNLVSQAIKERERQTEEAVLAHIPSDRMIEWPDLGKLVGIEMGRLGSALKRLGDKRRIVVEESKLTERLRVIPSRYRRKALRTSADKMKAKVFKAPEKVQNPGGWPSVFIAGAIDMGKTEDWQQKLTDALSDVECIILNPRRSDWDSSWEQSIENPKFKEQVEWELKGLEDATFVAMGLTKDSKAPISLLELGLHIVGRRMIVYCPEGFYRKGNIDVVCKRYGVPVHEDFEEFCRSVRARVLETTAGTHQEHILPAGTVRQQKQYYITAADRLTAREFVLARYRFAKTAVYRPIQMVKPWTDAYGNPVEPDKMQMQPLRRRPDYGEIEMEIEKRMKEARMNKAAVVNELVKIAKSLTARDSLLDFVLSDDDVEKLKGVVDEQSYELAVDVYMKLRKDLELSENQNEAILRLKQCVQRGLGMDPSAHRNNIFKAAHALGIHLPSSMF